MGPRARKDRLRRLLLPLVALVAVAGVAVGWQSRPPAPSAPGRAKPFTIRTFDGHALRLDELRGRPVVLDFWATWGAPCRVSMPQLSAMQARFATRGLVVIGLSVDDRPVEEVKRFAGKLGLRYPLGMATEDMLDDYGPVRGIPTTIFIDRKGHIVRRVTGYVDKETLAGFIREIL